MTARTLTLSDFLLARIADDADYALRWGPELEQIGIRRRWVAECEAKRRIVEEWVAAQQFYADNVTAPAGELAGLEMALRAIASVYASHPDYDEAWRP